MQAAQDGTDIRSEASETGRRIKEEARQRSADVAFTGKSALAEEVGRIGSALHSAAKRLHEENDTLADWADAAADRADEASTYLQGRSAGDLVETVEDLSRRNPGVAVSVMFLAGFALARFLKAGPGR